LPTSVTAKLRGTQQQLGAQALFQQGHAAAELGFGDAQGAAGRRKAAVLHHLGEVVQVVEVGQFHCFKNRTLSDFLQSTANIVLIHTSSMFNAPLTAPRCSGTDQGESAMLKKILGVYDGPVPTGWAMASRALAVQLRRPRPALSPFLLLDHAGPHQFTPTTGRRGVGTHPHRGFETVTIVYDGEVAHRDSTGAGGTIGPGDVQWMTAASGILHEEYHSEAFAAQGGAFEMVQLWVNLPAKDKLSAPGYQTLLNADIPRVALPDGAGSVRVIAGDFAAAHGPARTFTPINVWDVRLNAGASTELQAQPGHTLALVVLHGTVLVNGQEWRAPASWCMDRAGDACIWRPTTTSRCCGCRASRLTSPWSATARSS
jgi:redox-sensitive bicupin YhaK (pirin superfamily)